MSMGAITVVLVLTSASSCAAAGFFFTRADKSCSPFGKSMFSSIIFSPLKIKYCAGTVVEEFL
jgi:hypothetical protein